MTAKKYTLHMGGHKYLYTYDEQTGVTLIRLPGTQQFTTGHAPTPTLARNEIRRLLERATGQKARRSPERTLFLRGILRMLAEGGSEHEDISEGDLDTALAKVNNALTGDRRKALGISRPQRGRIAHASETNDVTMLYAADAEVLAEIVVHGGRVTYK